MQDSNLRSARALTTVFETAALPGSANPPQDAEGARIERAPGVLPGPRISNPVPYHSASPPLSCVTGAPEGAFPSDARESNAVCPHPK